MGSDGFEGFGFRWGSEGSGTKSYRRHVGPSSCHLGLAQCGWQCCSESECICVKRNLLTVEDTTYAHFIYSPTAECCGVFAQYRFRCVLGELGPFREGTGFRSQNQFWEPGTGFDGFRQVFCGSKVPGSVFGNQFRETGFRTRGRLRARGFEGFAVRWVPTG